MQIHFLLKCNECTFFHFIQMCILYIMLLITLLISEIRNVIHMQCMITYVINSNYLLFVYLEESAVHRMMSTMKAKQNKKKNTFFQKIIQIFLRDHVLRVSCALLLSTKSTEFALGSCAGPLLRNAPKLCLLFITIDTQ